MQYITGNDRNQVTMICFEELIARDSFVRAVDVFVEAIDIKSFGFTHSLCKEEGRPAYHPADMMKLYLYGYRHGIRSSRKLEREAQTNIEAIWLLKGLCPHYKTIANFRKDNHKAFRAVFKSFVLLLKDLGLIEGHTVAIDSFKIRASNSLKKNFNHKKLDRHLEYIENQIDQYEKELETEDQQDERQALETKLTERKEKKNQYTAIKEQLHESGQEQISLTDPDARSVVLHRNIINVGYNIQATCDEKHKLLVDYDTGTVNDTHALAPMATACKEMLQTDRLHVLADKGYHTGNQLHECRQNNITTFVSPKAPATNPDKTLPIHMFSYNKQQDTYTCPQGHIMRSNGRWYKHSDNRPGRKDTYSFKRYLTPECKNCPIRQKCTTSKVNGRAIDRSEFADVVEANKQRVYQNPDYYRQRQQIAEHQFGTLKRQMGYDHTNIRGKPKLMGELGLLFTVYNLVRCIHIFGAEKLLNALLKGFYANLNRKYRAFSAFLRNYLFLPVKNFPGPMMQQNSLYELSGYIFNPFFMMGKGYCTDSRYASP
jgi:transposase